MNRHERRREGREERRKPRSRTMRIDAHSIESRCDIQVDAKVERIVMIFANAKGRKVVEDLWPDVEWTTDEIFSSVASPDWLFTHIRVTKLPPNFEAITPLAFASPDALGYLVALALQQRIVEPRRVIHWVTDDATGTPMLNMYETSVGVGGVGTTLFAEYVPAGVPLSFEGEPRLQ
jgi:hypothetical protein